MSEPIKKGNIAQAPTPHNTPASVSGSYLKNAPLPTIPSTIKEDDELRKKLLANPAILSMIEGKLNTLVGTDSGYVKALPPKIKNRLYGLKALQQKQFKLEAEFQMELLNLEKKYHEKHRPIFEKRKKLVTGLVEPAPEEIEEGQALMGEEEDEEDEADETKTEIDESLKDVKGVPSFWLTAMENLGPIAELITDRDSEALNHLIDIRLEYFDALGFRLVFEFEENDYFTNRELVKTYYYQKELGYSRDFVYDHAEGCDIKWKDNDHNLTITVEKRKQRNKHTKQVRTIEKLTAVDSFFNFFNPPQPPKSKKEDEDQDEDEEEEQEEEDLEQRLQLDYEIGELFKDKLLPRAIDWFTGQALEYEYDDGEEEEYEEDYEEDEEDSEAEETDADDDSEEESSGQAGTAKAQQPAECKQQ
ncbi:hypothetical protein KL930_004349 [Ogataea haglerorum]|nr:hypothetical protein KL932_003775 [Ogataea haglerorum]KAG7773836.1 hypothetical protein KL930_004349 [Ogataea haglerorum]KAG7776586.1 hypothetical protein KL922_003662 [Ogataea haglerorum]